MDPPAHPFLDFHWLCWTKIRGWANRIALPSLSISMRLYWNPSSSSSIDPSYIPNLVMAPTVQNQPYLRPLIRVLSDCILHSVVRKNDTKKSIKADWVTLHWQWSIFHIQPHICDSVSNVTPSETEYTLLVQSQSQPGMKLRITISCSTYVTWVTWVSGSGSGSRRGKLHCRKRWNFVQGLDTVVRTDRPKTVGIYRP
jgi:hypothetical protein